LEKDTEHNGTWGKELLDGRLKEKIENLEAFFVQELYPKFIQKFNSYGQEEFDLNHKKPKI